MHRSQAGSPSGHPHHTIPEPTVNAATNTNAQLPQAAAYKAWHPEEPDNAWRAWAANFNFDPKNQKNISKNVPMGTIVSTHTNAGTVAWGLCRA